MITEKKRQRGLDRSARKVDRNKRERIWSAQKKVRRNWWKSQVKDTEKEVIDELVNNKSDKTINLSEKEVNHNP